MAIRGAQGFTVRATGICDSIDGSNAPLGAMAVLKDLVPNPVNAQQFVPRPASTQVTNFSPGFTTPTKGNALIVIGTRAYGMIASATFAGHDEPFCYDLAAGAFITVVGAVAANTPTSPATTGEWTPPTMAMVANRIMITHPGYSGAYKVGWIDVRSFTSATLTGTTHTSTLIDTLSSSPITAGWSVGDTIAGTGIVVGTRIVSMTATSVTLDTATTAGAAGIALTVTSGTPAAPQYGAGNTNTTALVTTAVAVANFNGRAYYAVNNGVQFSDALKPCEITASTQALVMGDNVGVNALIGLPLGNYATGGNVQALIAFKGAGPYFQITGDSATSNLAINEVEGSIGTLAPNTLAPTPKGVAYIAPDGLRFIGADGRPSPVVGDSGSGVNAPFKYAVNPTRMCMAFANNVLRVSVQNGYISSQAVQDYWYDFGLGIWTGPHSFPAALIVAYRANNDFIFFASGINAKLWEGRAQPSATSTYTENSVVMNWIWQSSLMPDNGSGNSNQIVESSLGVVLPTTQTMTILANDEEGNQLDTITLSGTGAGASIWNAFTWGVGLWGGAVAPFRQYTLPWTQPLVFKQMSTQVSGPSITGFAIGNLIAKYQVTGYQGAHTP